MMPYGMEYLFGKVGSAVPTVFPLNPCAPPVVQAPKDPSLDHDPGHLCRAVPSNGKETTTCSVTIHIPTKVDRGSNRNLFMLIYTVAFHGSPYHG